jgi:hypothetical protein
MMSNNQLTLLNKESLKHNNNYSLRCVDLLHDVDRRKGFSKQSFKHQSKHNNAETLPCSDIQKTTSMLFYLHINIRENEKSLYKSHRIGLSHINISQSESKENVFKLSLQTRVFIHIYIHIYIYI